MFEKRSLIKRKVILAMFLTSFFLSACGFKPKEEVTPPSPVQTAIVYETIETEISSIEGSEILLEVRPQYLNEKGYEAGDIITVKILEESCVMPIGLKEERERPMCLFIAGDKAHDLLVLSLNEDVSSFKQGDAVTLSMKEKQGHSENYPTDESLYKRTYARSDYPHLDDSQYANFRAVDTAGMGSGALYRSSSPVNDKIERNFETDEAISKAGVKTVFNMADHDISLKLFKAYEKSYYKTCNIIALNMSTYPFTDEFEDRFAKGLRFLIAHEGPYLIHCTEGKDRTGFAAAVLECLMGASADEVISDYMKTYENYYGVKLGSSVYNAIGKRTIRKDLPRAFLIDSLYAADLKECAQNYLLKIGLSEEEILSLKEVLSKDYQ